MEAEGCDVAPQPLFFSTVLMDGERGPEANLPDTAIMIPPGFKKNNLFLFHGLSAFQWLLITPRPLHPLPLIPAQPLLVLTHKGFGDLTLSFPAGLFYYQCFSFSPLQLHRTFSSQTAKLVLLCGPLEMSCLLLEIPSFSFPSSPPLKPGV